MDKLKKKKTHTTGRTKRLCKCTICHKLKLKELTPLLNCRRLLKAVSCHHQPFPRSYHHQPYPRSYHHQPYPEKRSPNFFASALVRNPSRCFVKRSAVMFFMSTRLSDLQNLFCFKKIDQLRMLFHLDFSTIFIVCFSIVCRIVTIFDCRHVLLGGMPLSSTLNARCTATGINESAEEDHPYTSPTRKLSASKSSLGRRP